MHKRLQKRQRALKEDDVDEGVSSDEDESQLTARKERTPSSSSSSSSSSNLASNGLPKNRVKYTNKQRCLVLCSRGAVAQYRHLMGDIRRMLPHHKKEVKLDTKRDLSLINEICEMKSCNTCLFFEFRKRQDLYLWMSSTPNGPSVKFLVHNVHTMDELKLTGNSLMGSRPILSFDAIFEVRPQLRLLKEMLTQVFGKCSKRRRSSCNYRWKSFYSFIPFLLSSLKS